MQARMLLWVCVAISLPACDSGPDKKEAVSKQVISSTLIEKNVTACDQTQELPEIKQLSYEQKISLHGYTQTSPDPVTSDKRILVTASYSLQGSTELGTIRVLLIDGKGKVRQHHKIIKAGQGQAILPIEYEGDLSGRTLVVILFRDEEETSGAMDQRVL